MQQPPTPSCYPDLISRTFAVSWDQPEPGYRAVHFTHHTVLINACDEVEGGWADPVTMTPQLREEIITSRPCHATIDKIVPFVNGHPQNPLGRTGLTGRGVLGRFGPNQAINPIVTRLNSSTGKLQVAVVWKNDGSWRLPGGLASDSALAPKLYDLIKSVEGKFVYQGAVDDPRNTDWAWVETTVHRFHIDAQSDDDDTIKWLNVNDSTFFYTNDYCLIRLACDI